MDRRQTLIVVVLVVFVLSALMAAIYFVQGSGGARASLGSTQRFTAKSGTSRENAVALSTSKRESSASSRRGGGSGSGAMGSSAEPAMPQVPRIGAEDDTVAVRSLSRPDNEDQMTRADLAIHEALNSIAPDTSIPRLEEALEGPLKAGEASRIHRALGQLHAQRVPPDLARAQAEFDRARSLALSSDDRHAACLAAARMRIVNGDEAGARAHLVQVLAGEKLNTEPGLEATVLLGQLHERAGDMAAAEASYRETLDTAMTMDQKSAEESFRIAGLRLFKLYRDQNRDAAAAEVAQTVRRHFNGAPTQGVSTSPRR